jgi:hypothetical protein
VSADNFMVPPVDRIQKPLVVRRVGVQDYQPQKEKEQSGQFESDHKHSDKNKGNATKPDGCIVTDHKIDCKI